MDTVAEEHYYAEADIGHPSGFGETPGVATRPNRQDGCDSDTTPEMRPAVAAGQPLKWVFIQESAPGRAKSGRAVAQAPGPPGARAGGAFVSFWMPGSRQVEARDKERSSTQQDKSPP